MITITTRSSIRVKPAAAWPRCIHGILVRVNRGATNGNSTRYRLGCRWIESDFGLASRTSGRFTYQSIG